jgi:membrane-associated protease RseP (regulator of RpoE activity)
VWIAILVTRVPIVNGPTIAAKAVPTPALRASSLKNAQDLISTWVIIPDSNDEMVSVRPAVHPGELEAEIKDTLKMRAFTDIGVSVSHKGEAFLAGDVYSLKEARRIQQIVHHVSGVRRVHFLHPDVHQAQGPAYFGVTTSWAPEIWGAKVQAVFIGSPADKAGIQPGDIISEFDGKTVPDAKSLDDLIEQYSPGQRVEFRVWHDGQPVYLVARLGEMTTMASR